MGYCTYYDDRNKVTDQGLLIKYRNERKVYMKQDGETQEGEPIFVKVHYCHLIRYATKVYRYVGMDKDTAKECLNSKLAKYTREYAQADDASFLNGEEGWRVYVGECRTDIAMTRQGDGDMWSVVISVNEEDHNYTYDNALDPASYFQAENMRSYDEDGERPVNTLILIEVTRKVGKPKELEYKYDASGIQHFNSSLLVFQWALPEDKEWHIGTSGVSELGIYTRLIYNKTIASNVVVVPAYV